MLKLKTLTIRNFLSVGNIPQVVQLDTGDLTLILGQNLDVGQNGSRNGTGKTTLLQALIYALYDSPVTFIKKDNLVNKTNNRNMLVALDFEKDGVSYRIERTRKPASLKWTVGGKEVQSPTSDETQGENKWTQAEIEKVIGCSVDLFRHIGILSTEIHPFLTLPAKGQRDIIEELFGVTQLTLKAEKLKELIKETKDRIREEEIRIRVQSDANERTIRIINDLQNKSSVWEAGKMQRLTAMEKRLADLSTIDIARELEAHEIQTCIAQQEREYRELKREYQTIDREVKRLQDELAAMHGHGSSLEESSCPTCGGVISDNTRQVLLENHTKDATEKQSTLDILLEARTVLAGQMTTLDERLQQLSTSPKPSYATPEDAYNHRATMDALIREVETEMAAENPYTDQIAALADTGVQEIDYSIINSMTRLSDHQSFLLKILTSKDSFIRKKIIDQNLQYLNSRLGEYLDRLGLPHLVRFQNDLSVEITHLGREFDYQQLSSGEKRRVCMALSLAFREIWESMNTAINMVFMDEFLDNGLDYAGVEAAYDTLKDLSRIGKSVFLISHREELISRATRVLNVIKENGFSTFSLMDELAA